MIRLIIIRFSESIARNYILIITPAIVVTILVTVLQLFQEPQFLAGATIQIRYNREISKVIGYEKFETNPADPAGAIDLAAEPRTGGGHPVLDRFSEP